MVVFLVVVCFSVVVTDFLVVVVLVFLVVVFDLPDPEFELPEGFDPFVSADPFTLSSDDMSFVD